MQWLTMVQVTWVGACMKACADACVCMCMHMHKHKDLILVWQEKAASPLLLLDHKLPMGVCVVCRTNNPPRSKMTGGSLNLGFNSASVFVGMLLKSFNETIYSLSLTVNQYGKGMDRNGCGTFYVGNHLALLLMAHIQSVCLPPPPALYCSYLLSLQQIATEQPFKQRWGTWDLIVGADHTC